MLEIYCDEAGNSGENLLDAAQPFFALASNDFSREEALSLLELVRSNQTSEPKFRTLRKTTSGVHRLKRLLTDPRMTGERIVVTAFDKQFMVITKMVDLIAETLFHEIGEDLYKQGANIAMANMLNACMPAFCGQDTTDRYLNSFVDLMRFRTPESIETFYSVGAQMLARSSDADFKNNLSVFTARDLFATWFEGIGELSLDPAIPALFEHIAVWGARKSVRFSVICDSSKPVIATKKQFDDMMMQGDEMAAVIGYDRRKFKFPLQAVSVEQADSALHPQIQLADICAGAFTHVLRCSQSSYDDLGILVRDTCLPWMINAVLPSTKISPEELGTSSIDGVNPVEEMVRRLRNRPRKRT
jgi:hypothetical protein